MRQRRERLGFPNEEIEIVDGTVRPVESARAYPSWWPRSGGHVSRPLPNLQLRRASCHVAVDPCTGHVDILDYVAIEDVGVAINPHIVDGQAISALVQGLGGVFLDRIGTTATRRCETRR